MSMALPISAVRNAFFVWLSFVCLSGICCLAAPATHSFPHSLPSHPGNVFIRGEQIVILAPIGDGTNWLAADYEGKTVAEGRVENGKANLGQLTAGYYELTLRDGGKSNRVSVGVLEPLKAPT